ncbi:IS3 family transposase [Syntrophomonas erecta]
MSGVRQEKLYLTVKELHENKAYPVKDICRILDLNRSSYYKWLHRSKSAREYENEDLLHKLGYLYAEFNGIYGYRRLTDELNARYETSYNYKRIYRLTRLVNLNAVIRRKRPQYQRSTPEVTAENILNRDFTAEKLNEKWLTDVTEFKYGNNEKLYLSAILDLKDRSIISFAMGRSNNNQLVFETFDLAVSKYPDAHPLFHSDRGFQYTSKHFKIRLNNAGMKQSMSRVGRCIDNGPMEGFWGTLKCEMYYLGKFPDYDSLVAAIESYIYFYNYERRQRRLNKLPPMTYPQLLENAA